MLCDYSISSFILSTTELISSSVDFSNDYDERLELGGISVENQFTMEDGKIYWIDESGNKIEQKTVEGGN